MSHQEQLQAGIQLHREGKLEEAGAIYQQILAEDESNPHAMHWLGLLAMQVGQLEPAVGLLGKAVQIEPNDPFYWHNFGAVLEQGNNLEEATKAYAQALLLDTNQAGTLAALGHALIKSERHAEAIAPLSQALQFKPDDPDLCHHLATAFSQTGEWEKALETSAEGLRIRPDSAYSLCQHAEIELHLRKNEEAAETYATALSYRDEYPRALTGRAIALTRLGQAEEAIALFHRAVELEPDSFHTLRSLAACLHALGRHDEAIVIYERALEIHHEETPRLELAVAYEKADRYELALRLWEEIAIDFPESPIVAYQLAALRGEDPPPLSPAAFTAQLFDSYAENFDDHLLNRLEYRAPGVLAKAVAPHLATERPDMLDLGCGTGLCGEEYRGKVGYLVGVDLSKGMIEKAKEREIYDDLIVADIISMMNQSERQFDLIIAGDVLEYLGDLSGVYQAAYRILKPNGIFAYSVEAMEGDGTYRLEKTRRYTHSPQYLRDLARTYNFEEKNLSHEIIRRQGDTDVTGLIVVLQKV